MFAIACYLYKSAMKDYKKDSYKWRAQMEIYVIVFNNDNHLESQAYYSTEKLAEKALKNLLRTITPVIHEYYYVRAEYVDYFHLPKEEN